MKKEYQDYVAELSREHPELAGQIASWHGMESVLEWMKAKSLRPGSIDLVAQDEFESDFLVLSWNRAVVGWLSALPDVAY
jgi:hypothetical protein